MKTPKDILLPYQRRWVDDKSRFKVGRWSRQTGKSFSTAEECVEDSMQRKTDWVGMSAGERQALEWMRKCQEWTEAYEFAIEDYVEDREHSEALIKSAEIKFGNGSRIIAIPSNPDTARGYSANLVLDEFAFHEKPDEVWRAIYPAISNPLKGEKLIRVVSTPNGQGNKFYDLCMKDNKWSKHTITIYDAVKEGLPIEIEELRDGLDDPDGWAQEYECQFIDSAAILLPYELIALAESSEATEIVSFEYYLTRGQFPRYGGLDFGRKRDLTVYWGSEAIADLLMTKEVLCLAKMSTPDQFRELESRVKTLNRLSVDYTGPGVGLGDLLVERFGEWNPEQDKFGKIELVTFNNSIKQEIFPTLKVRFENQRLRIPISRVIREDLHSMHRVTTPSGLITYRAPHTEDGHADRLTALALCNRAAGTAPSGIVDVSGVRLGANRNSLGTFKPRRLT